MPNLSEKIPVRRLMLVAVGTLMTSLLIPVVLSGYNDVKSLQQARLTKAVEFGDHNNDFNGKVNSIATLMLMFNTHNHRFKTSGPQLSEAHQELTKNYRERYLELDATAWWWPSHFLRELEALKSLSPDEVKQLTGFVDEYNKSVLTTVNAVKPLWHFLDSPEYKTDEQSQQSRRTDIPVCPFD